MTRDEFWEIEDFYGLYEVCSALGASTFDDIVFNDDLDREICEDIRNATEHDYWNTIAVSLYEPYENLDTEVEAFFHAGILDFRPLYREDLENYKHRVFAFADEVEYFEPDEEEEEEPVGPIYAGEDSLPVADRINFEALFSQEVVF